MLFVRKLATPVTEELLESTFSQFGKLERVKKLKDYAFVHFEERDAAVKVKHLLCSLSIHAPLLPQLSRGNLHSNLNSNYYLLSPSTLFFFLFLYILLFFFAHLVDFFAHLIVFCTSHCFLHILLFCTFLFHCTFYSYFSFSYHMYALVLCYLYNLYSYCFALSTERT